MFKKLKRKFILTNLLTSTLVLVIAFSSIYLIAASASSGRIMKQNMGEQVEPVEPVELLEPSELGELDEVDAPAGSDNFAEQGQPGLKIGTRSELSAYLLERLTAERDASLKSLLISLLVTGTAVELMVLLISIYLAEQSVKPVREAYLAQKAFVANASHEIKTPLAVIAANLEAADIQGNQWIDNVQKKVDDLTLLNNQLLELARSDSVSQEIKLEETDLNKLVDDAISAFEPKAEEQKKTITKSSSLKKGTSLKLNRQALEQILNIYIDNGIKYCKNTVSVNVKKDRIHVISDGEPMDEAKIPHLFDRFYQSDKTKDGVGLGLAIASSIAEKNGWELTAKVDEKYRTNIFTLKFK